jgi:DNA-binding MarR family transcriptional regulator
MMAMAPTIAHDALAMIEYSDLPSILVLSDSGPGLERARRSVETLGYRVSDTGALDPARLDRQVAMSAVVVEAEQDSGARLDAVLDRLESAARVGRFGSVVCAPRSLIDVVAARTSHPQVHHLCEPLEIDRLSAIADAARREPMRLHDVRKEGRLQQLSEEVGRIANILASLSEDEPVAAPEIAPPDEDALGPGQIRAIIRARRMRDHYFGATLFADPAWDMLLDLMAARLDRQRVAVSSLCIAAAVPATTALRWIKTLTDQGLFVRQADPQDGRRVYIELSDKAAAGLEAYLKAAQRVSPLIL